MKFFVKMIPVLISVLFLVACTEPGDNKTEAQTQPPLPPPDFNRASSPQELVDNYLADLASEKYVSKEMVMELAGRTVLVDAARLVRRHHTVAFIEWYFSEHYLAPVKDLVTRKVDRMDYQLKILEATAEQAYRVVLTTDVGVLEHKQALLDGPLKQEWQKLDDGSDLVVLVGQNARLPLRVVEEKGQWKLERLKL